MIIDQYGRESSFIGRVVRAQPSGQDKVTLDLDDNERLIIPTGAWTDALRDAVQQMIPAEPGTFIVERGKGENGEFELYKRKVVAWAINYAGELTPWTLAGANDGDEHTPPVLFPDGRVEVFAHMWNSLQEWIDAEQ